MKATRSCHLASAAGALALLCTISGCVVLPFGREGGEDRGEHGGRRLRDSYVPAPDTMPYRDAGDGSEHDSAALAIQRGRQLGKAPTIRPAVYLLRLVKHKTPGLWG